MIVYITSAYSINSENYLSDHIKKKTQNNNFSNHEITENPEESDIIIFAEHHPGYDPYFFNILTNPIFLKYKKKCYLYHDNDYNISLLPTVSPSIELKNYNPLIHQPFSYMAQVSLNPYIVYKKTCTEKKYLFSFIGTSRTNRVRKKIFNIKHSTGYLFDSTDKNSWELVGETKDDYFKHYAEVSFQSKFILCPRGIGPSSYRLFESLKMGIAPVIISDEWVKIGNINWEAFSIVIKEKDVQSIESILKEKEKDFIKMGDLARKAWENNFSDEKSFHYLIEACSNMHSNRKKINWIIYLKELIRFFEYFHFINLLRFLKKRIQFIAKNINILEKYI